MSMKKDIIIPKFIQFEVVFGCNFKCVMCPASVPSSRKKGIMSMDIYKDIVDEMMPYSQYIQKFDLWGMGEPLLDPTLLEKIEYAKFRGFRNLAIATNVSLLNDRMQNNLLESGIDTIIFSIDGVKKSTHESIRRGANFENVIKNTFNIIKKRDNGDYKTRFVVRFIKQKRNIDEFEEFEKFWREKISENRGDIVTGYNMHSWANGLNTLDNHKDSNAISPTAKKECHHVFDRLIFFWDGTVPMCCADLHNGIYRLGNIKDSSPLDIFNNEEISKMRKIHKAGKKCTIELCRKCTILDSEAAKDVF